MKRYGLPHSSMREMIGLSRSRNYGTICAIKNALDGLHDPLTDEGVGLREILQDLEKIRMKLSGI